MNKASLAAAAVPIILLNQNVVLDVPEGKRVALAGKLNLRSDVTLKREPFACGDHYRKGIPCVDTAGVPHTVSEKLYLSAMQDLVVNFPSIVKPRREMGELLTSLRRQGWRVCIISCMKGLAQPVLEQTLDDNSIPYDDVYTTYGKDGLEHQLDADVLVESSIENLDVPVRRHGKNGLLFMPAIGMTGRSYVQLPERMTPGVSVVTTAVELQCNLERMAIAA